MISPDLAFLLVAGLASPGLLLDALFDRLRVTSVLPLMLIGIALLYFRILPAGTVHDLTAVAPFVTALTIAFILFHVGLGIRFEDLSRVLGRALAFTLSVQVTTGIALAMLAWVTFHWDLLLCFVFGFALSGPSSISVPVLVRVARMPKALGTSLLFESVVTDLLQLLVPLHPHRAPALGELLDGARGNGSRGEPRRLDRRGRGRGDLLALGHGPDRPIVREYSWTLTITMVLATYGLSDYLGLSAAITIFVFGLMVGNRRHLEFDPLAGPARGRHGLGADPPGPAARPATAQSRGSTSTTSSRSRRRSRSSRARSSSSTSACSSRSGG